MASSFDFAIIPLAGQGTRWLPFTKSVPKEFLPIGTKPAVHYVVQEAIASGIKKIIFVISPGRTEVKKYFSRNMRLEKFLLAKGETKLMRALKSADFDVDFIYVLQEKPLGLGHAISLCSDIVRDRSFVVMLPDEILEQGESSILKRMTSFSLRTGNSVMAVKKISEEESIHYGMIKGSVSLNSNILAIDGLVEKPEVKYSPSNLAIIGRYAFTSDLFKLLVKNRDLTLAINKLASERKAFACVYHGKRYDLGRYKDFLSANLRMGLKNATWN